MHRVIAMNTETLKNYAITIPVMRYQKAADSNALHLLSSKRKGGCSY